MRGPMTLAVFMAATLVSARASALTNADVLGFEAASGWSASGGTITSSADRVQGAASLSVASIPSFLQVQSVPLTTLGTVTSQVTFNIKLPTSQPNPFYYGSIQLSANAPSRGVFNQSIGQKELTGMPLGSFQQIAFTVPASIVTALGSGSYSDLRFTFTFNVPSSGPFLLDNLSFGGTGGGGFGTNTRKVHIVYLVPSDRTVNPAYTNNLASGARHVQGFFQGQLSGKTYTLENPVVRVYQSTHNAAWFKTPGQSFHYAVIDDVESLIGMSILQDPNDRWLLYVDADNHCPANDGATGATFSVATFPANDLRGIAQLPLIDKCTGAQSTPEPRCRWVGGMAHELGHTLSLPHPPGCDASQPTCDFNALMYLGYGSYPSTYFRTADDIPTLNASPLIQLETLSGLPTDCSVLTN